MTIYRIASDWHFGPAEILEADGLSLEVSLIPGLKIDFNRVFPPLNRVVHESPRRYSGKT